MGFLDSVLSQIERLPGKPGVYIFRGTDTKALYVGKAKDLKKRVSCYLREDLSDWKSEYLRKSTERLDFKQTNSELSALILEAKMIEALQPPLNIRLKHDNPFLYFYFSDSALLKSPQKNSQTTFPKFELVRDTTKEGSYFGPFLNRKLARELYILLSKTFGLRSCSRKISKGCLYYHLGQCAGFCLDNFDFTAYLERLRMVKKFFTNGPSKFISSLGNQILKLNNELRFEEASILSRYQNILQTSQFDLEAATNTNFLMSEQEHIQHVWLFDTTTQLIVLLENKHRHLAKKAIYQRETFVDMSFDEILCNYYRTTPPPLALFTNFTLENSLLVAAFLKTWYKLEQYPEIIIVEKAKNNATFLDLAFEIFNNEVYKFQHLETELQKFLACDKSIKKIDCFDVSHHQELFIVASCVRFEDAKPNKSFYRQFKIKSTKKPNDYQSLREAVYRRYAGESEDHFPDLVLIDGGKGQLNAVRTLFPKLSFASLAKREERIYFYPLGTKIIKDELLPNQSIIKLVLTNIRDHAHNFAIKYHRKLKNKIMQQ